MSKRLLLLIFITVSFTALAKADSWDDFTNLDRMWDGQKSITNQEFEKVMDKLEEKGKQKEEKQKKKKRKKIFGSGTTLHEELNPDKDIQEFDILKQKEDGVLINIPVNIVINGKILEKGYYKVFGEQDKETNKIYLSLYQSQFFKGKFEAIATDEDYEEDSLDFAKILPFNESFVKIIFGSIDFNAYAYIPYMLE